MAEIHGGFRYRVQRRNNNDVFLVCAYRLTTLCTGRAIKSANEFHLIREHNHAPNLRLEEERAFVRQLYDRCESRLANTRDIYESLRATYADASRAISWRSQQTNMRRRQHNFIQSLPRVLSLTHLKFCLENYARYDNLTHHSHGSMQLRFRTPNNLGTVAVMGDSELIDKFHPNSTMYIGTTNTILPAGLDARETLIIVLLNRNHAFGVSWAFMPDRSEVSFNAALDIACSQIAPLMNPTKIYYDYEQRLNDSLRANIPDATLKGTFLAYANVMIRRATLLNVDLADVNNQIIFKKLLAVALLPAASVVTGFLWLRSNIPGELVPIFEDLFVYYQDNLINLLGSENGSFYNDVDSFSDSMKNHIFNLNTLLNNNNSIWNCLRIFVNQSIRSYNDFHALDINARVSCTPRSRPFLSLKKLRRVWNLFDRNQIEYQTFFASTSQILTEFTNDLLHNGVEHIHDFRLFQDRNVQINIDADNVNHQTHFVGPLVFAEETIDDVRAVNRRAQRVTGNLAGQPQVVAIQVFDAQDNVCILCVDRPISQCFSPCGHQVACLECTENWRATAVADGIDFACPICRTIIREVSIIPAAAA